MPNAPDNSPPPSSDPSDPPAAYAAPAPSPPAPHDRRDFFTEALKGTLAPLSNLLERRINPMLRALEDLPRQAEELSKMELGTFDQPHLAPASGRSVQLPQSQRKPPERLLRPPGALPPGEFESVCSRCAKCVEVCPADAIKIDPAGLLAEGLPYIVAADQPCVVCSDLSCMKNCPSGALKLVDIAAIRMGTAKTHHATCLRSHGEECRLCVEACPLGETAITISPTTGKVRVKKDGCIGCGLCESRCPTEPRSIFVVLFTPRADPIIA